MAERLTAQNHPSLGNIQLSTWESLITRAKEIATEEAEAKLKESNNERD